MKKLTLLLCFVSFLTKAQNITVASGKSFTIEKTGAVTMSGNFSNAGTFTLNSDSNEFSSIIIGGTVTGNISYNRYVNSVGTNEWDLIGAPVEGQSINSFVTANASTLASNGDAYAIGYYDNYWNEWENYTTSSNWYPFNGNFLLGMGFQMATISGGTLKFTGAPAATNKTQPIIDFSEGQGEGGGEGGTKWNLVANPFPSYIHGNTSADSSNNFLTINSEKLHASYQAIYGYDADGIGSGYTVYNNTSAALRIAPGQAFMVASDNPNVENPDVLSFTTAMRTTEGDDDFIAGRNLENSFELILKLYEGDSEIDHTKFYFGDGLGLNLDPGYDAGHFNQGASLMSRLVEEDEGVGLVINAMGLESVNDVVAPLEINRASGNVLRVSIDNSGINDNINVYLEDKAQGTMTLLNDQDFELTAENELSGIGRFFIHLTETVLSIDDKIETNYLNVFKADVNNFITVEGLANQSNGTKLRLYTIRGKEVIFTTLNNTNNKQTISTQGLSTGIYIVKLESGNILLTKKLFIK
ncbi:T9SS type A sorting domain-containing protein [Flavobacteriaceae bacterium]|nr:T9SS type A sorting domain-containing protein [Flavobacteriaceae bacterium]MDB4497108.1 T9SS type A sorting domain-containing protein [Flavobacteriaceae bacterium]MDB4560579.1 T9SS type A sorting domain-containing protein [Flavobacteriaceae bacterium]